MTTQEYLDSILTAQKLADDGDELKELRQHREEVEKLLRQTFDDSSPTIRYGGSKAKGTMVKDAYDLDIICYFPSDETDAGGSLEDIYNNVKKALEQNYYVTPKTSALRLQSKDALGLHRDFHIDVVPGRYVDGDSGDCYIYQSNAEKHRLKTNLDVHIDHVRDSGVIEAIKLLKVWRIRKGLQIKQFVWELLVIKLLDGKSGDSVEDQLRHVWEELRDSVDPISVEDPANPAGNDLSGIVAAQWAWIKSAADMTLRSIESSGWESVFGTVTTTDRAQRIGRLTQAASTAGIVTKQWGNDKE
jgi:hypothetical protein